MTAKIKFAGRINSANSVQNSVVPVPSGSNSGDPSSVKLPSMEFVKFDGDIRQWLTFWNCFKKIDENKNLSNVDKFQYLNQAMVSGSEADNLIKSYPLTAANYEKALKGLKNRFGQDEMLIEVYVRELLQLVLQKAINPATNPCQKICCVRGNAVIKDERSPRIMMTRRSQEKIASRALSNLLRVKSKEN